MVDGELVRYIDNTDRAGEQSEHFNTEIMYPLLNHLATHYDDPDSGFKAMT
jgi:hypothetical protein